MEQQKTSQANRLNQNLLGDAVLLRAYLGSPNDWNRTLAPNKTGFQFDGSFNGY